MKNFYKLLPALVLSLVLVSCSDDPEAPGSELFGSWIIGGYTLENFPTAYARYEGATSSSLYGESSYVLELEAGGVYTRVLTVSGTEYDESGDWTFEEDLLLLDPTGTGLGLDNEFTVVSIENKDMILSAQSFDYLTSDVYADTVSSAYETAYEDMLDSLYDADYDKFEEEFLKNYSQVYFDIQFEFDLQSK